MASPVASHSCTATILLSNCAVACPARSEGSRFHGVSCSTQFNCFLAQKYFRFQLSHSLQADPSFFCLHKRKKQRKMQANPIAPLDLPGYSTSTPLLVVLFWIRMPGARPCIVQCAATKGAAFRSTVMPFVNERLPNGTRRWDKLKSASKKFGNKSRRTKRQAKMLSEPERSEGEFIFAAKQAKGRRSC